MPEPINDYPTAPRVAVGAIVIKDSEVLLVRRANAPAQDVWAIPGGSVNLGESLQQAAEREILEETSVRIGAGEPVLSFDYIDRDPADLKIDGIRVLLGFQNYGDTQHGNRLGTVLLAGAGQTVSSNDDTVSINGYLRP